jgi:5'-3' exonuclease
MGQPVLSGRPLLVIDGDSFAHRSYHALPKTIRSSDGKAAGAILGFANFVLRLYTDERPRAVIVGWDTLEAWGLASTFTRDWGLNQLADRLGEMA